MLAGVWHVCVARHHEVGVGPRRDSDRPGLKATAAGLFRDHGADSELGDVSRNADQSSVCVPVQEQEAFPIHVERPSLRGTIDLLGDQVVIAMDVGVARAPETSVDLGMALPGPRQSSARHPGQRESSLSQSSPSSTMRDLLTRDVGQR